MGANLSVLGSSRISLFSVWLCILLNTIRLDLLFLNKILYIYIYIFVQILYSFISISRDRNISKMVRFHPIPLSFSFSVPFWGKIYAFYCVRGLVPPNILPCVPSPLQKTSWDSIQGMGGGYTFLIYNPCLSGVQ